MHYLGAYFLFFRNMHFSPILGTSNVKITEYRQISLVKSFSKIQRYSGILVFCGETTFVGTSVHVRRIEIKTGTELVPCIIINFLFFRNMHFPSILGTSKARIMLEKPILQFY